MKKSNINTILGFSLLGIGGYFLIKRYMDSQPSSKSDEEEGLDIETKSTIQTQEQSTSVTSGNFLKKKKTLQELLGFKGSDVDGIIGSKTKKALASVGVTQVVTESNIDSIIKTVQSKISNASKDEARVKRAKEVVKQASFTKTYTWVDGSAKLKLYKKDKLGKYNYTGSVYPVEKGQKITGVSNQTVLKTGFIRATIKTISNWGSVGSAYIYISPYSVTVY